MSVKQDQSQSKVDVSNNAAESLNSEAQKAQAQESQSIGELAENNSYVQRLLRLMRLNVLAISIGSGMAVYFIFHYVGFLAPIKYPIKNFFTSIMPGLIFALLFFSFCKVEVSKMRPRRWHWILIVLQLSIPALVVYYLVQNPDTTIRVELEGLIACVIAPTAAAAAVITGKLGGDESSLTTYTLLCNLGAAVGIPLLFPFISANAQDGFVSQFLTIMSHIFPMIVLPLIIAQCIRMFIKPVHRFIITKLKDVSFYLWAFTLSTVSATAFSNIMNSPENAQTLTYLALVGLIATVFQFGVGKIVGHLEGQRISAGQAMGQKNMVFGIWIALAYLSPASSIAPGCYILWQNVINSWQLYYREAKHITYHDKM